MGNHDFDLKAYLVGRKRSEHEEQMNCLLQKASGGKITVEDMQIFLNETMRPLDFIRKYEKDLALDQGEEFMNLFMQVWNETPRKELHGRTPQQMDGTGKSFCKLCATKPKCPDCGGGVEEGKTTVSDEGDEATAFLCKECNKTFQDIKIRMPPQQDEETAKLIEKLAEGIADHAFDGIWKEAKKETKDYSKKDLAGEMFYNGAIQAFSFLSATGLPKKTLKELVKALSGDKQGIQKPLGDFERKKKT